MTQMSEGLMRSLNILPGGDPTPHENVDMETGEVIQYDAPEPAKLDVVAKESVVSNTLESDIAKDYLHARNLLYTLLDLSGNALAGSLKVATESEHPRAYDVFNSLAVTMRGLTQDLLALQKNYKEVSKDNPDLQPPAAVVNNTQINNFASGSTNDIIRVMAEQEEFIRKRDAENVVNMDDYTINPRLPNQAPAVVPETPVVETEPIEPEDNG